MPSQDMTGFFLPRHFLTASAVDGREIGQTAAEWRSRQSFCRENYDTYCSGKRGNWPNAREWRRRLTTISVNNDTQFRNWPNGCRVAKSTARGPRKKSTTIARGFQKFAKRTRVMNADIASSPHWATKYWSKIVPNWSKNDHIKKSCSVRESRGGFSQDQVGESVVRVAKS